MRISNRDFTLVHDRVTLLELCLLILVRFRRNHAQKHSNDQHRSCTRIFSTPAVSSIICR
jgi:hypothetical protein